MVGTSKILTVSYGTFSCTLEGFDDSFGTMKAIAEYFRDLASDDRYFGAEPPTPDTEMLQRIAEREIRRQVDARLEGDGVVLRARDEENALARPTPVGPAPQERPAPEPQADEAPSQPVMPPREPEVEAEAAADDLGSVAARLARIRAVVDSARSAPPTPASQPPAAIASAAPAAPVGRDAFEDEDEVAPPAPNAQAADTDTQGDAHDAFESQEATLETAPEGKTEPAQAEQEVAADQRDETDAGTGPEAETDETPLPGNHAEIFPEDGDETGQLPDAVISAPAGGPDEYDDETATDDQDSILSAVASGLAAHATAADIPAREAISRPDENTEPDITLPEEAEADEAENESPAHPFTQPDDDADTQPEATGAESPEDEIRAAQPEETPTEEIGQTAAPDDVSEPEAPSDDLRRTRRRARRAAKTRRAESEGSDHTRNVAERARARVMKVKRAEMETGKDEFDAAQPTAGDDETQERPSTPDSGPLTLENPLRPPERDMPAASPAGHAASAPDRQEDQAAPETEAARENADLSPEDEADLMAELAELENETAASRTRPGTQRQAGDDAAVNRLMDQVNTRMEGPEHKRRRSAIAHLKAAVAATVADRGLKTRRNQDAEVEAQKAPYQRDLREVVRPTHPSRGSSRQMPPLMLVSEQRIDRPDADATRHAAQGNLALQREDHESDEDPAASNIFSDDDSFADFAERMGAQDLPELLEAAAAYCMAVEKHDAFTRPQVMQTVAEYFGTDDFPREDGLRAFGALLREGPFERVRRGEFTISRSSRFMSGRRQ